MCNLCCKLHAMSWKQQSSNYMTDTLRHFMILAGYSSPGVEELCAGETFQPRCPGGRHDVIIVLGARYGRMKTGRCVKDEPGLGSLIENPKFLGCFADVRHVLVRHCSGRYECDVRVVDQNFAGIEPCFTYLKLYLEVSYMCVKGMCPVDFG
jgi:Galactose binding lectin domain